MYPYNLDILVGDVVEYEPVTAVEGGGGGGGGGARLVGDTSNSHPSPSSATFFQNFRILQRLRSQATLLYENEGRNKSRQL